MPNHLNTMLKLLFPNVNLPMQRIQQECQDVHHIPPWEKPLDRSIMHDWKGVKEKKVDEKKICGGQINKSKMCALVFTWIEACDKCFPLHTEECIFWDLYTCHFHTFYPDERKCSYISKWRENWLWDLRFFLTALLLKIQVSLNITTCCLARCFPCSEGL